MECDEFILRAMMLVPFMERSGTQTDAMSVSTRSNLGVSVSRKYLKCITFSPLSPKLGIMDVVFSVC